MSTIEINPASVELELTASQREELDRIAYLLSELAALQARGLLTDEAMAVVSAEKEGRRAEVERTGRASAALRQARSLLRGQPARALTWAEFAREAAPEVLEGWTLGIDALSRLGDHDSAIRLCRRGADAHGHAMLRDRAAAIDAERQRNERLLAVARGLVAARSALAERRPADALASCEQILARDPGHLEAKVLAVDALERLGRTEEAACRIAELLRLHPTEQPGRWAARLARLQARSSESAAKKPEAVPELASAGRVEQTPPLHWRSVATEFFLDHWQKLILGLALLLIVVSSTVGASILLGERLWSPEGKCVLALAYTIVVAATGSGLSRWGARRAGQLLCLATLLSLPIHFTLIGEQSGAPGLNGVRAAILGLDVVVLLALGARLGRHLTPSASRIAVPGFLAMALLNAVASQATPPHWGYGLLLLAASLFLLSVEGESRVVARRANDQPACASMLPSILGLLTFVFLWTSVRLGAYLLRLPAHLYALPVMLAAAAVLRASDALRAADSMPDRARIATLLRSAGFGLSALAVALALTRPPSPPWTDAANLVATAVLGTALYADRLRRERLPQYLYVAIATLALSGFATRELFSAQVTALELAAGYWLGYSGPLPTAFRALNGLALSVILIALALVLDRRLASPRLAWHCHAIGLPLSIAACLFAAADPLAGLVTMSGYAVLHAIAARRFRMPALMYLVCAAWAGAGVEAATWLGHSTGSGLALVLTGIASSYWAIWRVRAARGAAETYIRPIGHSGLVVSVVALVIATEAALPPHPITWGTVAPFAGLALLFVSMGRVVRHEAIAQLATGCTAGALALAIRVTLAASGQQSPELVFALWISAESAAFALGSLVAGRRGALGDRSKRIRIYARPLLRTALVLAALGTSLAVARLVTESLPPTASDLAHVAPTLELAALAWVLAVIRVRRPAAPAWLAVSTAFAGLLAGGLAIGLGCGLSPGWPLMAVVAGWAAFAAAIAGESLRTREAPPLSAFRAPLLAAMVLGAILAIGFGIGAWDNPGMLATALAGATLALALATRQTRVAATAYVAMIIGLACWLCSWAALAEGRLALAPTVGVRTQLYLIVLYIVHAMMRRRGERDLSRPSLRHAFRHALPDILPVASLLGLGCALAVWPPVSLESIAANLALGAVVMGMTARLRREVPWAHMSLGLGWLAALTACLDVLGVPNVDRELPIIAGWLAGTTAVVALLLGLLYAIGRRSRASGLWINAARDLADMTALVTFGLAAGARLLSPDVFPTALAALLVVVPPIVLVAAGERTTWRAFGAIGALVGAAYLVLFELGRGRPGDPSALGVLATSLALAFWRLERLLRLGWAERWRMVFAGPLRISVLILAVAALSADWDAPRALLFAALPFLLLIVTWPAAEWLHAVLGIVSASLAFAVLQGPGQGAMPAAAVAWAFVCWVLGMAIRRSKAPLCHALKLPCLDFERPAFDAALSIGLAAIVLRLDGIVRLGEPWSRDAWLPLTLSLLAVLLLATAFAHRVLADASIALASFGVLAMLSPWLSTGETWLIAGLALANGWELARRGVARSLAWRPLQQLGELHMLPTVLRDWSVGIGLLASLPLAGIVVIDVLATLPGLAAIPRPPMVENWTHSLIGLAWLVVWVALAGRDLGQPWSRVVPHGVSLLIVWWVGVSSSPIVIKTGLATTAWLPLATMVHATALAWWTARRALSSGVDPEVVGARWSIRAVDAPLWLVAFLSSIAVVLTGARVQWSTPATLLLGVVALAFMSETVLQPVAVRVAALFWLAGWSFVGAQAAQLFQVETPQGMATYIAAGLLFGAGTLFELSGRLRRRGDAPAALLEPFTIAAAWGVAGLMAAALTAPAADARQALVALAVLIGVGALFAFLARRNGSSVLAHAAHGAVLAAYVAYRRGWSLPVGSDAVVLLILAALDLGLAEVFERLSMRLFARPAVSAAVLLPAVSLGLSLWTGPLSDESQFLLGATAAFYALAGVRLRHRGPAYVAALLCNAFLWLLWYRSGWNLARDPQFYLIPAGLTAILFAESHRRILGRHWLNAIRGVGLGLIYLSLAVPIGQVESLGAWVALLLLSLLGIFVGIGLRAQVFLWLGLASFLLSLAYQLGRLGVEHALARWAIMLALGLAMVLFVAFSEKKRLVATMHDYLGRVRHWD